jgi:hypothetical protein
MFITHPSQPPGPCTGVDASRHDEIGVAEHARFRRHPWVGQHRKLIVGKEPGAGGAAATAWLATASNRQVISFFIGGAIDERGANMASSVASDADSYIGLRNGWANSLGSEKNRRDKKKAALQRPETWSHHFRHAGLNAT